MYWKTHKVGMGEVADLNVTTESEDATEEELPDGFLVLVWVWAGLCLVARKDSSVL